MNSFVLGCLCCLFLNLQSTDNEESTIILEIYDASYSRIVRVDTISVDSALARWHTDSLGCLGQRTVRLSRELMEKLKIIGKRHDEVIQLLGKPNEVYYNDLYVGAIAKDGVFLVLRYYLEQECIDGEPVAQNMGHVSIHIIIDLQTNVVVSYS